MDATSILSGCKVEKAEKDYKATGFCGAFALADKSEIGSVAEKFREKGFFLETIVGYDKGEGIKLVYIFNRMDEVSRTAVAVDITYDEGINTISNIYNSAVWFESEVYDLLGVNFAGHPSLKRLLTPEGMSGFPLLKSWKAEEE